MIEALFVSFIYIIAASLTFSLQIKPLIHSFIARDTINLCSSS